MKPLERTISVPLETPAFRNPSSEQSPCRLRPLPFEPPSATISVPLEAQPFEPSCEPNSVSLETVILRALERNKVRPARDRYLSTPRAKRTPSRSRLLSLEPSSEAISVSLETLPREPSSERSPSRSRTLPFETPSALTQTFAKSLPKSSKLQSFVWSFIWSFLWFFI